MKRFLNLILDNLYPMERRCSVCGNELPNRSRHICSTCLSSLEYMDGMVCLGCGKSLSEDYAYLKCPDCRNNTHYFDAAYSCFEYNGMGKNLIHKFKYEGKKEIAKTLAELIAQKLRAESLKAEIIIPVPIHEKKRQSRGFNQALLIAEDLSARTGIPVFDCLQRQKETQNQYSLDKSHRMLNVYDAFSINLMYNINNYKSAILLDDVYTTGSTVNECSRVLKKCGLKQVVVVTCATGSNT